MTTGRLCVNSINIIYFILFSEETEGLVGEGKKTSTRKQKVTTGRSCINSVNLCKFFFLFGRK